MPCPYKEFGKNKYNVIIIDSSRSFYVQTELGIRTTDSKGKEPNGHQGNVLTICRRTVIEQTTAVLVLGGRFTQKTPAPDGKKT